MYFKIFSFLSWTFSNLLHNFLSHYSWDQLFLYLWQEVVGFLDWFLPKDEWVIHGRLADPILGLFKLFLKVFFWISCNLFCLCFFWVSKRDMWSPVAIYVWLLILFLWVFETVSAERQRCSRYSLNFIDLWEDMFDLSDSGQSWRLGYGNYQEARNSSFRKCCWKFCRDSFRMF